jgi:proline racemase
MAERVLPVLRTVDYHTGGEPFRIVLEGAPELPGATVRERRELASASAEAEDVRRLLCHEPRGHADMYGCFVVPPDDDGAHFGVLFWHKDGYSTACGHGTIALGVWAVESGRVQADPDGDTDVVIDVPSGRVVARVTSAGGSITSVAFRSVPSYVLGRDIELPLPSGPVLVDVSYGGAVYASVPAAAFGLSVSSEHYGDLIRVGREVKRALAATKYAEHPSDPRLSGVYGTILYDDLGEDEHGPHQSNVTVFADGQVDRSPCGSGTAARVALLADAGRLGRGRTLIHDSIVGTRFTAEVVEDTSAEGRPAVVPEVRALAYHTGDHTFVLHGEDPVGVGFVLR